MSISGERWIRAEGGIKAEEGKIVLEFAILMTYSDEPRGQNTEILQIL